MSEWEEALKKAQYLRERSERVAFIDGFKQGYTKAYIEMGRNPEKIKEIYQETLGEMNDVE